MLLGHDRSRLALVAVLAAIFAAVPARPQGQPAPVPAPLLEPAPEKDARWEPPPAPAEQSWPGLPPEVATRLAESAKLYADYLVRFTATETARTANYTGGEVDSESVRRYGYLLERVPGDASGFREFRQNLRKDGSPGRGEVNDEEPFPPSYAWVFLFSEFNQPYFAYREIGERFEGFDWVREIEFRGAVPFTDGRDIRQWEGRALIDAVTFTPVEIRAEPSRQKERVKLLFERWQQAFNLVGFHIAPRPFGHQCQITFRLRRDRLSFPTEMRYSTFRAMSAKQTSPWKASMRSYDNYRFFRAESDATAIGKAKD